MRQERKLKEKVGNKTPFVAPEGYFKSLKSKVMDSLPEYPEKPAEKQLSTWQRIKPYVYLAAMFAGIWCMMQMFHRVSTHNEQNAQEYTAAITSEQEDVAYDFYIDKLAGADIELEDELTDLYVNLDDFKRDFYAQF